MTGTVYDSGASMREQGVSKNGHSRVRRMLMQLTWRCLIFQPSGLAQWLLARAQGGGQGPDEEDHGRRLGAQAPGGALAHRNQATERR
jgi:hypothetical protein